MTLRFAGNPIVHRILAFALALVGGHAVGQALRTTGLRPLLDFGPLYVGAWMVREGRGWDSLYDPVFFSGVVSHVAPAGRILDLGATPPALVLLAYPFTWFTPEYGKFLFASGGVLVLLFGLFALGAGRTLGWNRSEWIAVAGLVLGSGAASESVVRAGAVPWIFGFVAFAVSAHALGRTWVAAVISGIAANLSPIGWAPLFFSLRRGPNAARLLAGGVALGGLLLQVLALGPRGLPLFWAASKPAWLDPNVFDSSWPGRLSQWDALGGGSGAALVGAVLGMAVAGLLWIGLTRSREWFSELEGAPTRVLGDRPRVLGVGPALLLGILLLGVSQPMRGFGLLWGIPVWASLAGFELRPSPGRGLVLLILAFCLLLPAPIGARLGPDTSANLIALASVGLVLWWTGSFRPATPRRRAP